MNAKTGYKPPADELSDRVPIGHSELLQSRQGSHDRRNSEIGFVPELRFVARQQLRLISGDSNQQVLLFDMTQ